MGWLPQAHRAAEGFDQLFCQVAGEGTTPARSERKLAQGPEPIGTGTEAAGRGQRTLPMKVSLRAAHPAEIYIDTKHRDMGAIFSRTHPSLGLGKLSIYIYMTASGLSFSGWA